MSFKTRSQILSQTPLPSLTQHPSMPDPKVQGPPSFGLYYSSWGARSLVHPHRHPPRTHCGHRMVSPSKWLRRMGEFRLLTEHLAQWGTWTRWGGPWGPGTFPNPQLHLNRQITLTSKPLPWPAKPLTTASSSSSLTTNTLTPPKHGALPVGNPPVTQVLKGCHTGLPSSDPHPQFEP